jgi:hypothetical protein
VTRKPDPKRIERGTHLRQVVHRQAGEAHAPAE